MVYVSQSHLQKTHLSAHDLELLRYNTMWGPTSFIRTNRPRSSASFIRSDKHSGHYYLIGTAKHRGHISSSHRNQQVQKKAPPFLGLTSRGYVFFLRSDRNRDHALFIGTDRSRGHASFAEKDKHRSHSSLITTHVYRGHTSLVTPLLAWGTRETHNVNRILFW